MFMETLVKIAYPFQVAVAYSIQVKMLDTLRNLKQLAGEIKLG